MAKKSLSETHPEIAKEWHPTKNGSLTPDDLTYGSAKDVWWRCALGHEWTAFVYNRTKKGGTMCPACAPVGVRKLVPGFNDLATLRPDVAEEWHPTRNSFGPHEVPKASRERVWWMCSFCGREWDAVIKNRTSRNTGCPSCRGRKRGLKVSGNKHRPRLYREWSPKNKWNLDDFSTTSSYEAYWVCQKGHEWKVPIYSRSKGGTNCRRCSLRGTSFAEQEVYNYIKALVPDAQLHDRSIAPNYEYDISVPSRKIVVEYNGVYWHTEQYKPQSYHRNKFQAASDAGWQQITVWEDDWLKKPDVVKKMLAHKLHASDQPRYGARNLIVDPDVSTSVARRFLDNNHIQGHTGGSVRLGLLTKNNELVALMVFRKRNREGVYELIRYATDGIVQGGFSKLFIHFTRSTPNLQSVVSFSDYEVSDGGLYLSNGFKKSGVLDPDYTYLVDRERKHKFGYRKKRFETDPDLVWKDGLTERELAELNNIHRIWDSGKIRWEWVPSQ